MWIIIGVSIVVVLALCVAAAFFFVNAVQKSNDDFTKGNTVDKLTTYKDSGSGISLKVPDGWDVTKTKPDDKSIVRLTVQPPAGSFSNAFDEQQGIDLLCSTISSNLTSESFAKSVTTNIIPADEAKGLTVTDESSTTIDGRPAYLYKASKQDDKTRTTYYHSYYLVGPTEVCDTYVLAVTGQGGGTLPIESFANDILRSVRVK